MAVPHTDGADRVVICLGSICRAYILMMLVRPDTYMDGINMVRRLYAWATVCLGSICGRLYG